MRRARSSRARFDQYKARRKQTPSGEQVSDDSKNKRRPRTRSFSRLFLAFWEKLAAHRFMVLASLGTLTFSTLVGLVLPASTKFILDYVLTNNPGPSGIPEWIHISRDPKTLLWITSGVMIVLTFVQVFLGMWGRWQTTRITKRLQVELRREAFTHAVRLPLHRIYAIKTGGVSSMLREDAGGASDLLFGMIYNPWRAVIQLVGTLTILTIVDWRLLIGSLALIPTIAISHRTWIARIRPVYRDIRIQRTTIDSHATEAFGGMRIVRGFNRERGEAARFVGGNHYMARQELMAWWWSRMLEVVWQLLIPLASALVMLYGGYRVLNATLTIGDVMMFSAYLLMLLGPLEALVSSATTVQNALAGFDRILDLLDEEPEFASTTPISSVSRATARGAITLDNVWFTYPNASEPVIKGISLDVEPGETIALVGPSGAGKTTISNLAARFYDPDSGSVRFDDVDLREIDAASFRSLLGIVEQDVFLFDGTVFENIAYARRGATRAAVESAAHAANADVFIESFEDGYDTIVGERGVRLSGGQKQRIAIARAILADPTILILDEATSNLDTESERLIQRSLTDLMRGRTSFVIAHRLSTIRHASRIAVIEDGRITEIGPHEVLVARDGRYAELVRLQVEGDQPSAEAS